MVAATPTVAPRGPVLVCYRQDDGSTVADRVAAALRAVGVPAWIDRSEMGVGTFTSTFQRAAERGLSGTVFVATPNVVKSDFIKEKEAPAWDALAGDPDFILAVVNAHPDAGPDGVDYGFPDTLLPGRQHRLADFKQYVVSNPTYLDELCSDITFRRLEVLQAEEGVPADELRADLSTRATPSAAPTRWELRCEIGPPPDGETLLDDRHRSQVRALTRNLPRLADRLGARTMRVRGGIHLPVAAAVGLSLPTTRPGTVVFHDNDDAEWASTVGSAVVPDVRVQTTSGGSNPGVAVLVDTVSAGEPGAAFNDLVRALDVPSCTVTLATRESVAPGAASGLAQRVCDQVRTFEATNPGPVHLVLRTPAGLAVHVGRRLNALDVDLYDFDRQRNQYVHFARARAGGPNVITEPT